MILPAVGSKTKQRSTQKRLTNQTKKKKKKKKDRGTTTKVYTSLKIGSNIPSGFFFLSKRKPKLSSNSKKSKRFSFK